jgi:hypothetical protein
MITEGPVRNRQWTPGKIAGAFGLVACGWLMIVIALTFGSAPGKSMAIIGRPSQALAAVAQANGRILASNAYVTIARSDEADFVAKLYAAGAMLVLDAEQAGGCSGLPPGQRGMLVGEGTPPRRPLVSNRKLVPLERNRAGPLL